jgi:hypothetical protein
MSKKHDHDHGHEHGGTLHFEQISHHGVAYENRDLSGTAIFVFMIILVITTAVIALGLWGYYAFAAKKNNPEPALSGVQEQRQATVNGNEVERYKEQHNVPVMIQPDDQGDMSQFKEKEDRVLNSYGWVDKNTGVVHIPIDAAIKEVARKGLPARPAQPAPTKAEFASGDGTPAGNAGGTRPETRQ